MRIKNFSRAAFRRWLAQNPTRRLLCGNENRCAVAAFVADIDENPYVEVELTEIRLYSTKRDLYEGEPRVRMPTPKWAARFISRFDDEINNPARTNLMGASYRLGREALDLL